MLTGLTHHMKLPDLWQHQAVNHLRDGSDVIVCAPTGAGKTYIFELFVKAARLHGQAVYTVPTRALANDKYAEWKDAGWDVGLATGDISENVLAPVLVATLETQLERLLTDQGPDMLVLDEFQMIADTSRGAHYEGAIVLAPPKTRLLLLSGSVENPNDVADWMRRLGRQVEVVATRERPVPLEEMPLEALPHYTKGVEGRWPRLAAAVLMADLAPLLIFAPRRKDAENIAGKLAAHLPQGESLSLTNEQRALAGREFAGLLEKRIAYHHSGLGYGVRAGLVEPLAKAGQLRVIVSTMGLAAGINFSVRSVHVASTAFHDGLAEQQLTPDDLLQMFGRAGRRGLDERGYVITTRESPVLADGRAVRLRRSSRLSWPLFLRVMQRAALDGRQPFAAAREFASRLFAKTPPELGLEDSGGFAIGGGPANALFGLRALKSEIFNSEGIWEESRVNETKKQPLSEAWLSNESYRGPALASTKFVHSLAPGLGRLFKLTSKNNPVLYGKEIALGQHETTASHAEDSDDGEESMVASPSLIPTQAMRKLLGIPKHLKSIAADKTGHVLLPKLAALFDGAMLAGTTEKEHLLWAQFDFSGKEVECLRDSGGYWITQPLIRTVERSADTDIREDLSSMVHRARPGTPVHAWRSLGLIETDGSPTRRGVIFSYFQHGEGLAIAATLEDENYPLDELVPHLANLRSDCRFDLDQTGGSERLAAVCRSAYGFVNHHGYLEAGLPLGYGEGTAELLGIMPGCEASNRGIHVDVAEGDLSRARIEWLSLLRHIIHAPEFDWLRWMELKRVARQYLESHLAMSRATLHPKLPKLTPKQKHDKPKHWMRAL